MASVSGGQAPYSYQWFKNGKKVAATGCNGSCYLFTVSTTDNNAVLEVDVMDAAQTLVRKQVMLTVVSGGKTGR
jgi:hypothetical protein